MIALPGVDFRSVRAAAQTSQKQLSKLPVHEPHDNPSVAQAPCGRALITSASQPQLTNRIVQVSRARATPSQFGKSYFPRQSSTQLVPKSAGVFAQLAATSAAHLRSHSSCGVRCERLSPSFDSSVSPQPAAKNTASKLARNKAPVALIFPICPTYERPYPSDHGQQTLWRCRLTPRYHESVVERASRKTINGC